MKLKPCPVCEKEISTKAYDCPQCGHPIRKRKKGRKLLWLIMIFVMYSAVMAFVDWCDTENARDAVQLALPNPRADLRFEIASLYGGYVVVVDGVAFFWVQDSKVFHINKLAEAMTTKSIAAPVSVTEDVAVKALKGEVEDVLLIDVTPETVVADLNDRLGDAGKTSIVESSDNTYQVMLNGAMCGSVAIVERGGKVASLVAEENNNDYNCSDKMFLSVMATLNPEQSSKKVKETLRSQLAEVAKDPKADSFDVLWPVSYQLGKTGAGVYLKATPLW